MDDIQIDKGVPIPEIPSMAKYPWKSMDVGDSFVFPEDVKQPHPAAAGASKRLGKKFIVKKMDGAVRCWRVA